jgi:hypothetical protein
MDALKPTAQLLIKLGSLIVHYQELNSTNGHSVDKSAIDTIEGDAEFKEWIDEMNKDSFLPVKR